MLPPERSGGLDFEKEDAAICQILGPRSSAPELPEGRRPPNLICRQEPRESHHCPRFKCELLQHATDVVILWPSLALCERTCQTLAQSLRSRLAYDTTKGFFGCFVIHPCRPDIHMAHLRRRLTMQIAEGKSKTGWHVKKRHAEIHQNIVPTGLRYSFAGS